MADRHLWPSAHRLFVEAGFVLNAKIIQCPRLDKYRAKNRLLVVWLKGKKWRKTNTRRQTRGRIDNLLNGAIDPHVHSGPSIAPRGVDHLELVRDYSAAGFAAVVTKDHDYSGVMTAALISKHYPELRTKIIQASCSTMWLGGFNPYAVEHTAAMGGKIVWLPTWRRKIISVGRRRQLGASRLNAEDAARPSASPCSTADGRCETKSRRCSTSSPRTTWSLASGHLHVSETWLVFEEAKRRGVKRLVLTHPEDIVDASMNDVSGSQPWAPSSSTRSACSWRDRSSRTCLAEDLRTHIEAAGVDNTILCSDLGQTGTKTPLEGFREGDQALHRSRLRR